MATAETVAYRSRRGRGVVLAAVLGTTMALLDGTVVNIALRTIGEDLHAGLTALQWISNGYLLSLASLILLGGALADRIGRRKVFVIGTIAFAVASAGCAAAPHATVLVIARIVQGIGAALLTPGSLAMIQASIRSEDRGAAIGSWSGLGSIAVAIGPFVGGGILAVTSWRWIFLINLPVAVVTVWAALRYVPETRNPAAGGRFDLAGAVTGSVALGGLTYGLIELHTPAAIPTLAVGGLAAVAFVILELRRRNPMVPPSLFRSAVFTGSNVMTFVTYGALGAVMFFLVLQLQTVGGWQPLSAGLATMPVTIVMFLLASYGGRLGARIGPRLPMTVGPLACAVGTILLVGVGPAPNYWRDVLPGMTIFGLGLALLVAPLTATVLAAAPDALAGIASGVNNAVARAGSLLAVAALPALVGLAGNDYADPIVFDGSYQRAMWISAGLLALGGFASLVTFTGHRNPTTAPLRR